MNDSIINLLNSQQRVVVTEGDGPCLVLAGAGSGKTKTIVHRVAYLLSQGVEPSDILLLTFTNKAAREMMERCNALLGHTSHGIWGGTFHHIANRMLRQEAGRVGYTPRFTILDEDDKKKLLKQSIKVFGEPPERAIKPEVIGSLLSYSTNTLTPIQEVVKMRFSHADQLSQWFIDFAIFFRKRKKELNAMDFDDLLVYWLELVSGQSDRAQAWQRRFRYVLVDEYQDINRLQDAIVERLASVHHNLLVVGDDAQSIYGFRGADVDHIRSFPQRFPHARMFPLTINYRSTPEILEVANAALKEHHQAFKKELQAQRGSGVRARLWEPLTLQEEAQAVIDEIRHNQGNGISLNDQAVLFRASASSITMELELQRAGIPYILRGGTRFFEQAHIKDMVSAAKVMQYWHDELAWARLSELLPGVGPAAAARIWTAMKDASPEQLDEALARNPSVQNLLKPIISHLKTSSADLATRLTEWFNGWYRNYLEHTYDDAQERSDDCVALCSFVSHYTDPEQLFADIALSERFEKDSAELTNTPRLVCSTIHQAKGLEWSTVILIGLVDGALPHYRSLNSLLELEEERRLLYVAVTRAKDELILSSAREGIGGQYALPSRFIEDIKHALDRPQEIDSDGFPVIDIGGKPLGILDKVMLLQKRRR